MRDASMRHYPLTFPWKATHSGAQPPVGATVGATVALTKSLLLLQMEASSKPQLMSFQKPACARENSKQARRTTAGPADTFGDSKLTHVLVYGHAVLVVVGKVGLVLLPGRVGDRRAVHPAARPELSCSLLGFSSYFRQGCVANLAYLNDLSKFTYMPI